MLKLILLMVFFLFAAVDAKGKGCGKKGKNSRRIGRKERQKVQCGEGHGDSK